MQFPYILINFSNLMNDKLKKQRSFLGKLAIFDKILQTYADIFSLYLCIFWPRLVLCHSRKEFGK